MKKISDFFKELSDEDLCQAILEIKDWHKKGILADGICRKLANVLKKEKEIPTEISLKIIEENILMESSTQYIKLKNHIYPKGFNLVDQIICDEFDKKVGRNQKRNVTPYGMLVSFNLTIDYNKENGYRHLDLLIYGPYNYIGVFAREYWNVIKNENLIYDSEELNIKKEKDYVKGKSFWFMESYHDSCWRDGVNRILWKNQENISTLCGSNSYWYKKIEITNDIDSRLTSLMNRRGDYKYEKGKDVFKF